MKMFLTAICALMIATPALAGAGVGASGPANAAVQERNNRCCTRRDDRYGPEWSRGSGHDNRTGAAHRSRRNDASNRGSDYENGQ